MVDTNPFVGGHEYMERFHSLTLGLDTQVLQTHSALHTFTETQAVLWKLPLSAAAKRLVTAQHDLGIGFACLVPALLAAIDENASFTADSDQLERVPVAVLYAVLFRACEAYSIWDVLDWPPGQQHASPSLLSALANLATWQLHTTRLPGPFWFQPLERPVSAAESFILLAPAVGFLRRISREAAAEVVEMLEQLPVGFFTTVCCVASEQMRQPAKSAVSTAAVAATSASYYSPLRPMVLNADSTPRKGVCKDLMQVIYVAINAGGELVNPICMQMCTVPAAREVCRFGFMAVHSDPAVAASGRHLNRQDSTLLLTAIIRGARRFGKVSMQASPMELRNAGLSMLYPDVGLSPRRATTDRQLVRLICQRWPDSPSAMHYNARLLIEILRCWPDPDRVMSTSSTGQPQPRVSQQSDAAFCLMRMARQGSGYTLRFQRSCKQRLALVPQPRPGVMLADWSKQSQLAMVDVQELMLLVHAHAWFYAVPVVLPSSPAWMREQLRVWKVARGDSSTSPELLRLNAWTTMAGTAAVLEASLRDSHRPQSPNQACLAAIIAIRTLPFLCQSSCPRTLRAAVSLACTIRKMIQPHTELRSCAFGATRRQAQSGEEPFVTAKVQELLAGALVSITTIDRGMQALRASLHVSYNYPAAAPHSATDLWTGQGGHIHVSRSCQVSASNFNLDELNLPITLLHQVETVLFATVVVLCQWRIGSGLVVDVGQLDTVDWITSQCRTMGGVESGLLAAVESTLKAPLPQCDMTRARQGFNWGLYEKACFNGRLVVGCCNLACTNVSGASEAALRTKLCSGCKKARYCSAGCQEKAWFDGGHRLLCRHSWEEGDPGPTRDSERQPQPGPCIMRASLQWT